MPLTHPLHCFIVWSFQFCSLGNHTVVLVRVLHRGNTRVFSPNSLLLATRHYRMTFYVNPRCLWIWKDFAVTLCILVEIWLNFSVLAKLAVQVWNRRNTDTLITYTGWLGCKSWGPSHVAIREVLLVALYYICSVEEWMWTDCSDYRLMLFVCVRASRYIPNFSSSWKDSPLLYSFKCTCVYL